VADRSTVPTSAILQEARRAGPDPALVNAVVRVESDYRADTVGAAGEIGLMQVLPATARLLGFVGSDRELAEPATNIRLGVTYLAKAWRLAQGDLCRALMKLPSWPRRGSNDALVAGILPAGP
jgi:soluble lytic murein transglycosylase-like protein